MPPFHLHGVQELVVIIAPRISRSSVQYKVVCLGLLSTGIADCNVSGMVLEWMEKDAPPFLFQTVPSVTISKSPASLLHASIFGVGRRLRVSLIKLSCS